MRNRQELLESLEEEIYQEAKKVGMKYKLSPNKFITIIKRVLKRKLKENEN